MTVRLWIAATLTWLLTLFALTWLHHLPTFACVFAVVAAVVVVSIERISTIRTLPLISTILATFVALRWSVGIAAVSATLVATLVDCCLVLFTVVLSRYVATGILTLERNSLGATQSGSLDEVFQREFRRARQFGRSLAVLAVEVRQADAAETTTDAKFLNKIRRGDIAPDVVGRLAELIKEQTKECDVIAYSDDCFFVLLPEGTQQVVTTVTRRLRDAAQQDLDVQIKVGSALFPADEVTLSGLLQRCSQSLNRPSVAVPSVAG